MDDAGLQSGVEPEQSVFERQPTQRLLVVLQTGVEPEQSALVRHATQRFAVTSHLGAAGLVQSASAWQMTHEPAFMPLVTHAGPPGLPTQSALLAHARHMCDAVSQVGVSPAQSELNSHPTQVPLGKSQMVVLPVQAVALVDEHCPHAPHTSHAGVAGVPVQSASEAQASHLFALQIGESPPQSPLLRHCTQAFEV